jgi:hypothetical protein
MHDIPSYFLHQDLERDICKLWRKDILEQISIPFSDSVTRAQYWHRHLRAATISEWGRRAGAGCSGHVATGRGA